MKRHVLRGFVFILIISMTAGLIPVAASANDNELVLTKIGHTSANTVVISDPATRSVTLVVPYAYASNSVDMLTGLIAEKASNIADIITSFNSGSVVQVNDATGVPMTVTYYKTGNPTSYTTAYTIKVVRAAKIEPTFSGTITKTVTGSMPNTNTNDIVFSAADFTSLYTANDGAAMSGISIEGSNLSCGNLKYAGSVMIPGTFIALSDINKLTFDAVGAGSVTYAVYAYSGADHATKIGSAMLKIVVSETAVPTITGSISKSVHAGSTLTFSASDFTSRCNLNNGTLKSIVITPTNYAYGTWYKGSGTFSAATSFRADEIGLLTFRGTAAGQATFTWTVTNESGTSAAGSGSITVGTSLSSGDVTYTTPLNTPKAFSGTDFNAACTAATGYALKHIDITPPSSICGTFYLNYFSPSSPGTPLTTSTRLYYSTAPLISNLTFVPASGYTGTFSIYYTGTNIYDAAFTGSLKITVGTASTTGEVTYTTPINTPKVFNGTDFNTVCASVTGYGLKYIDITPPSASYGTIYYNYVSPSSPGTALTSLTRLYYSSAPLISSLTFVPASGYTGTFSISYTGANVYDAAFTGSLKITVGASSTSGEVTYTTPLNTPKTFSGADFNAASTALTGYGLKYIDITPPSSTYGTFYLNYFSSSSPGTPLTSLTRLYYSGAPLISNLTFVPASGYTGTFSIFYTGANLYDTAFTGSLKISVGTAASGDVTYTTAVNTPKTFSGADFNAVCTAATGYALKHIDITPPSSAYGTIYYDYFSPSSPGTPLTSVTRVQYSSEPFISSLTFVPASGYSGTFTVSYTGANVYGTTFTGSLKITVGTAASTSGEVTYTTPMNTPKTFSGADFNAASTALTGYGLKYIDITPPSSTYGTLYLNYFSSSSPGTPLTTLTRLYYSGTPLISSLTFVPASGYSGTFSISYTGANLYDATFTGTLKITVGASTSGDVTYTTPVNTPKTFSATDFNAVCTAVTGYNLKHIDITPPSSAYGTLYYNYVSPTSPGTALTTLTRLQYNSEPFISSLTFVPASGYSGTFSISYTGANLYGTTYNGSLKMTVGTAETTGSVTYTTTKNTPKQLLAADFNTACLNATGSPLNTISIASPSSIYGTLYTGYISASSPGTPVTATTLFYMNGTPSLSDLTFVPASNFTGTVTISYGGVAANGTSFAGSLVINVTSTVSNISYTTTKNASVKFSASDFISVCTSAMGANLNYVTFTLPPASSGTLYSNYSLKTHSGTAVTGSTVYFAGSSPSLDQIYFVPAANYTGTVSIAYTATTADSRTYNGKINVVVNQKVGSRYFSDVGSAYDWAATAIDYLYEADVAKGTSANQYSPGNKISRGDYILMLYRAIGFTGTSTGNFADVPKGSYYYDAIAAAKSLGIAQGGSDNKFNPGGALTRQDAMLFLYRALTVTGKSFQIGTSSDIASFTDKDQISGYALVAVQTLVKAGIITGSNGKINPKGTLTRAEMAVIIYRVDQKW